MRYKLLFITQLLSYNFLFSQDAILSQYNSTPLYTNMAMAGSKGCSRLVTGTRLQWLKMYGGYKTHYFSYDQYSRHLRSGIGIQYYSNNEFKGTITNNFLHFSFSPSISVGKRGSDLLRPIVIKPALNFGFFTYRFDWDKYNFGDMIDPHYGYIYQTQEVKNGEIVTAPDFGTGIFIYGTTFFGGFYIHHITEPEVGILFAGSPLPAKMTLHGGYLLKGEWLGDFTLTPSFIFESQSGFTRTDITLMAKYNKFSFGVSGRLAGAVVLITGFEHKFFKIGYSYDLNTTSASRIVGATHEILIGFNFACRKEEKKIRTLDFPAF